MKQYTFIHFIFFIYILYQPVIAQGASPRPYLQQSREAYILNTLNAFEKTSLQKINNTYRYISVVDSNNCRSSIANLRVECLLNFAKDNCKSIKGSEAQLHCQYYSDIIVVNKLSENIFIPRNERYRMMKNSNGDFRNIMLGRLQQKYARIVTLFSLTDVSDCGPKNFECLAKKLDNFCLDFTNKESLSWQYCLSAVAWFIGTSR